jgi:hypothetical protein
MLTHRSSSSESNSCLLEGGGPLAVILALRVLDVVPFAVARELSHFPRLLANPMRCVSNEQVSAKSADGCTEGRADGNHCHRWNRH